MKLTKRLLVELSKPKEFRELFKNIGIEDHLRSRAPCDYRKFLFETYVLNKRPRCKVCGDGCVLDLKTLGFAETCSQQCSRTLNGRRLKRNMKAVHGVANPSSLAWVKKKKMNTCRRNFGTDFPQQSKEIRQTLVTNNLKKYGVTNVSQVKAVQERRDETFQRKFGGNPYQNEDIKRKIRARHQERFGVDHPMLAQEVRDKVRATFQSRYGANGPGGVKAVRDEMESTMLKRYGVRHQLQDPDIHERQQQSGFEVRYSKHDTKLRLPLRGYEALAVDWIQENLGAHRFTSYRSLELPPIWYKHDGKIHRYFPDFVMKDNAGNISVVEIKSTFTIGKDVEVFRLNKKKFKAAALALNPLGVEFVVGVMCPGKGLFWIRSPTTRSHLGLFKALRSKNLVSMD